MIPSPPKWADKFLQWYCNPDLLDEIQGDAYELYERRLDAHGKKKADLNYLWDVFRFFRWSNINKTQNIFQSSTNLPMLKNYIKIAVRNLSKNRTYTFINVFGLAISMSICLLIILFIMDQDLKDEYNPNAVRTYRILSDFDNKEKERITHFATSPYELKDLLSFNQEDIESISQLVKTAGNIKFEDKIFGFGGLFASDNFFEFFHYQLATGSTDNALTGQNSVVISTEMANKLFGNTKAIGQLVTIKEKSYTITGILDDKPVNSHLEFDMILSIDSYLSDSSNEKLINNWDASSKVFYNYIQLKEGNSPENTALFLSNIDLKFSEETKPLYGFSLQRLDQINLGKLVKNEIGITTPSIVSYFFMVLALVLILSASFNYMNLSIARALKRAREVGVRKIVGASKKQIIIQFLIESQIVMLASMVLGVFLLNFLIPIFNNLKVLRDIDGAITMDFISNLYVYIIFILFSIGIGLVAGIYPAIHLSKFKSLSALKGISSKGKSASSTFRKVLVFLQYSFSLIFIITTIIIYQQANLFVSADYGFNRENIMNVSITNINYDTFREELLKRSEISGVSAVSALPVLSMPNNIDLNVVGSQEILKTSTFSIDPYTISNLGLNLIAGRNFKQTLKSDQNDAMIINRLAAQDLGFDNPEIAIGQTIEIKRKDKLGEHISKGRIIGVVDDFIHQFIFIKSGALAMFYNPSQFTIANIRYAGNDTYRAELAVESAWKTVDNIHPFEYESYEYQISDIDAEFKDLVYLIGIVAFLAIVIACMGQFSMVVQHIELKIKEIGIRKVLGSSVSNLMLLLSKGFIKIILIAIIIATPLAWKINVAWTSKLALQADVSFLNLSFGILITVVMSFSTILFLVVKAAQANPVESLKYNG